MLLQKQLTSELKNQGANFVHFVNISALSFQQNRGYHTAILFGIVLSPGFIQKVSAKPHYVSELVRNNQIHDDEFHNTEIKTDQMADFLTQYITSKGYDAFSQSEKNLEATGFYHQETKSTPLPHKTIARLAGFGWIGKHNLLVNPSYGSAISMCTVLTSAQLKTEQNKILESQCGNCKVCSDVCPVNVIKGKSWDTNTSRDEMVNVYKCTTCLRCLALCPWTQKYVKKASLKAR